MPTKRRSPKEKVPKLKKADVRVSQRLIVAKASRQVDMAEVTNYRSRRKFNGRISDQGKRLQELEAEIVRLRRVVSDLTFDKLILEGFVGKNCA